jgi:hypothetical protein
VRFSLFLGILLLVFGSIVLVRGVTYTSERKDLEVGGLRATYVEKKSVPSWFGVAAVAGGLLFILAGVAGSRSRTS